MKHLSTAGRACALALLFILACSGARSVVADLAPTTPSRGTCTMGAWRCSQNVPEHCERDESGSTVTRWWPKHGMTGDGTRAAPCARDCVVDDGGPAHCDDLRDAGADDSEGGDR